MLDASIYNQKPQSFADAMGPWVQMLQAKQNIEQSQATTANMQAQNPGIIAESAMKQKQAAGQAWLTDNAAKFKNEDGSINMSGLVNAAKSSGHVDLAQQIALNDAKQLSDYATAKINEATATFAPQTAKATADKSSAEAARAATDAVASTWGHLSTFLKGLPPDQQAQAYMAQRDQLMKLNPNVFTPATLPEYNGKNMKEVRAALESGSMTPEVTKNLELGFGTLGVSQKQAETSRIGTVAPIVERAVGAAGAAQVYQNGVKAVESLGIKPTMLGTAIQQTISKFGLQDPRVQQLQAAIDTYNAENGTKLSLADAPGAINVLRQAGANKKAAATVPQASGVPNAVPQPEAAPVAPAAQARREAPPQALQFLKAHPEKAADFKAKYGYLPGQ